MVQLTVLESLVFSARLRHPATTPVRTVYAFVGEVRCCPFIRHLLRDVQHGTW